MKNREEICFHLEDCPLELIYYIMCLGFKCNYLLGIKNKHCCWILKTALYVNTKDELKPRVSTVINWISLNY